MSHVGHSGEHGSCRGRGNDCRNRRDARPQRSSLFIPASSAAVSQTSATDLEPAIVATSQQSRFHRETLVTSSKEIDLATVNISVNQLDLLVDAHLRLKEGVRYGLIGQNGVGKTGMWSEGFVVGCG